MSYLTKGLKGIYVDHNQRVNIVKNLNINFFVKIYSYIKKRVLQVTIFKTQIYYF